MALCSLISCLCKSTRSSSSQEDRPCDSLLSLAAGKSMVGAARGGERDCVCEGEVEAVGAPLFRAFRRSEAFQKTDQSTFRFRTFTFSTTLSPRGTVTARPDQRLENGSPIPALWSWVLKRGPSPAIQPTSQPNPGLGHQTNNKTKAANNLGSQLHLGVPSARPHGRTGYQTGAGHRPCPTQLSVSLRSTCRSWQQAPANCGPRQPGVQTCRILDLGQDDGIGNPNVVTEFQLTGQPAVQGQIQNGETRY